MSTEIPLDTQISHDVIEATAQKLHELFGMKRSWFDLSEKRKDVRRAQAREILLAGGYRDPKDAEAAGWDHCVRKVGAALRLVAPDHITPMGERQILRAIETNPYAKEAENAQ